MKITHPDEEEEPRPDNIPPALWKAVLDPFDYAIGLKSGMVIRFQEATIVGDGKWVYLSGLDNWPEQYASTDYGEGIPFPFPRGIEVRLDDIEWVADAPAGS